MFSIHNYCHVWGVYTRGRNARHRLSQGNSILIANTYTHTLRVAGTQQHSSSQLPEAILLADDIKATRKRNGRVTMDGRDQNDDVRLRGVAANAICYLRNITAQRDVR